MEDWQNAIKLEEFIRGYTPKGYKEPIHRFDFIPYVSATEYKALENAYHDGMLLAFLESYKRQIFNFEIQPFNKPYIISAIKTFFDGKEI